MKTLTSLLVLFLLLAFATALRGKNYKVGNPIYHNYRQRNGNPISIGDPNKNTRKGNPIVKYNQEKLGNPISKRKVEFTVDDPIYLNKRASSPPKKMPNRVSDEERGVLSKVCEPIVLDE